MVRQWKAGDPDTASITFSFKDWSSRPTRSGKPFNEKFGTSERKSWMDKRIRCAELAVLLGNYFGLVAAKGAGFYDGDAMTRAVERGRAMGLTACLTAAQLAEMVEKGREVISGQ